MLSILRRPMPIQRAGDTEPRPQQIRRIPGCALPDSFFSQIAHRPLQIERTGVKSIPLIVKADACLLKVKSFQMVAIAR